MLTVELKWAHYPDKVYHLESFKVILHRYWKYAVFLGFVTVWYDIASPPERAAMDELLRTLPTVTLTLPLL